MKLSDYVVTVVKAEAATVCCRGCIFQKSVEGGGCYAISSVARSSQNKDGIWDGCIVKTVAHYALVHRLSGERVIPEEVVKYFRERNHE